MAGCGGASLRGGAKSVAARRCVVTDLDRTVANLRSWVAEAHTRLAAIALEPDQRPAAVCAKCRAIVARWWLNDHAQCPSCGNPFVEAES